MSTKTDTTTTADTTNTAEVLTKAAAQAQSTANNAPKTFDDFPAGTVTDQGDLILVAIPRLPKSAKVRKDAQMADGNSPGSRHILKNNTSYDCDAAEVAKLIAEATTSAAKPKGLVVDPKYIGPVFETPDILEHPEHGAKNWTGAGFIACVFQRNLDSEQREERVHD